MASQTPPLIALVDVSSHMGGVEFSTLYLAEQLTQFRCVVICPTEGDLPQHCRARAIPVEIVNRPRLFSTRIRLGSRLIVNPIAWLSNFVIMLIAAWQLARYLRGKSVDLICTKGLLAHFYGGLAARWAHIPCVWHIQDLTSAGLRGIYRVILGRAARHLANFIIADGAPIAQQLQSYFSADRITIIHNGVDLLTFSLQVDGQSVRREWAATDSEILIGNIARLVRWKGQDILVRAFGLIASEFPKARLIFVGSALFDTVTFEQELHALVRELDLSERVLFAGYRWDLPQVLAALDIYVHASIEKDTSPLSVVSALACGKPIIASNVAGVAELFTPDVDGILVEAANIESMANGLRRVLRDADLRRALSRSARQTAEKNLGLPEFARQCEQVFTQALAI